MSNPFLDGLEDLLRGMPKPPKVDPFADIVEQCRRARGADDEPKPNPFQDLIRQSRVARGADPDTGKESDQ